MEKILRLVHYAPMNTLTRLPPLESRQSKAGTLSERLNVKARETLEKAMNSLLALIKKAIEEYDEFLPPPPAKPDWEDALKDAGNDLQRVAAELRRVIGAQPELNLNVSKAGHWSVLAFPIQPTLNNANLS